MTEPADTLELPLFEEGYFRRSLGPVVTQPDVALAELVANAWDAGATRVDVRIPAAEGGELSVTDDGGGMTEEEFRTRWLTLRYDRKTHQGTAVEFPPGTTRSPRFAYGRNGVGRHAMFCFADEYEVRTGKGGNETHFHVRESAGNAPFEITLRSTKKRSRPGTRLSCRVSRNLPTTEQMSQVLAAHFLYDPEFLVLVNGVAVPLQEHAGLIKVQSFKFGGGFTAKMYTVRAGETARTKYQHGVAFWVGGSQVEREAQQHSMRLVGQPSWTLASKMLLDGRTKEAKRLTFIVEVHGFQDFVKDDWTGFRTESREVAELHDETANRVDEELRKMLSSRASEKVNTLMHRRAEKVRELSRLGQQEVREFARDMARENPLVPDEVLTAAVDALIRLENSRSGQALIQKLAALGPDDLEGLNRLLEQWTVRDALAVLDEIGRRMRIVEAIERLGPDRAADELPTLHPLVAQARWLFGPEFDTPHYISNVTIRTAVSNIVGESVPPESFINPRKRPDLLFLDDSTFAVTGVEGWDGPLSTVERILLLELKKGDSTIGRDDITQADGYVQDLIGSTDLPGRPVVQAFVVGTHVDQEKALPKEIKDSAGQVRGYVTPTSYNQLVETANRRLFRLRERVDPSFSPTDDAGMITTKLKQGKLF